MLWEKRRVVFADEALEADFRRLAVSRHPEDERLHVVLKAIRAELRRRWRSGKRITSPAMISEYERVLHRVPDLWRLKLHRHGTVIYSVSRNRIQILDIL